jgi:hypothetical protein
MELYGPQGEQFKIPDPARYPGKPVRSKEERTQKLEQEFSFPNRDYDLLKANYKSLMDKRIQFQMAENMEKKQSPCSVPGSFSFLLPSAYVKWTLVHYA